MANLVTIEVRPVLQHDPRVDESHLAGWRRIEAVRGLFDHLRDAGGPQLRIRAFTQHVTQLVKTLVYGGKGEFVDRDIARSWRIDEENQSATGTQRLRALSNQLGLELSIDLVQRLLRHNHASLRGPAERDGQRRTYV